jgi:hypothetical protein
LGIASPAYWLRAATASRYRQHVLAKKPAGYWRLGEAAGTMARDESGDGLHGTYCGSPALHQPGAIKHDEDTAITLDGKGAYVEVPGEASLSVATSGRGLTVEAWMRPDQLEFAGDTSEPHIHWLSKGAPGQHEWALRFYSRNSARPNRISAYIFNLDGGLGAGAYFEDKLLAGNWIHVVACFDPSRPGDGKAGVSIYRDGKLRKGPAIAESPGTLYREYHITPAHGTAPVRFGTRDLKHFLAGGLDEVAIYPRVLTAAEIRENYLVGTGG